MVASAARIVVLAALVCAVAGCTIPPTPASQLEIGVVTPTTHLDPARGDEPGTALVARFAFETLPQLASHTEHDASGRQWTFTIPPGRTFQDGTRLDARAVAANVSRWMHGSSGTDDFVAFARTFGPAAGPHAILSAVARDVTHVVVTTRGRFAELAAAFADPHFALGSPAAFADARTFDRRPVGSGPYAVATFAPSAFVMFEPARGAPKHRYERVFVRDVPDPYTTIISLETGDLRIVYGLPQAYVVEARANRLHPVEDPNARLWCGFAPSVPAVDRACPPGP